MAEVGRVIGRDPTDVEPSHRAGVELHQGARRGVVDADGTSGAGDLWEGGSGPRVHGPSVTVLEGGPGNGRPVPTGLRVVSLREQRDQTLPQRVHVRGREKARKGR